MTLSPMFATRHDQADKLLKLAPGVLTAKVAAGDSKPLKDKSSLVGMVTAILLSSLLINESHDSPTHCRPGQDPC
jgi:hypothetical protein